MRTSANYAPLAAAAAKLSFPDIQRRLAAAPETLELSTFRSRLDLAYLRVNELLRQSPGGNRYFSAAELSLLRTQFRVSLVRDELSHILRGVPSRAAICEMSEIVGFLANVAGAARSASPAL